MLIFLMPRLDGRGQTRLAQSNLIDVGQLGAWQIITLQSDLWNLPARELNGHVITCLNMKNLHIKP